MDAQIFSMNERQITCDQHGEQIERGVFGSWFGCPVCNQERKIIEDQEELRQAKEESVKAAGIPALYKNATLKGWHITDERQQRILIRAMDYAKTIKNLSASPNFVLAGATGTGKTHIAASILRMAANQMLSTRYVTAAEIMDEIRASWDASTKTRGKSQADILRYYGSIKVLAIDEIGVSDRINNSHDIWSTIFDMRYREKIPTIITTNLDKTQLEEHLGDRAFDRMMQRCVWAGCNWKSYRQFCADVEDL